MSSDPSTFPAWQSADGRYFYVFVYGTLRRGEINDIVLAAERHGIAEPTLVGSARMPGRLFDYGNWPGILPVDSGEYSVEGEQGARTHVPTVLGDVFYAPIALLAVLDDIEGIQAHSRDAFYREPCSLQVTSGEMLSCVYYPVDEESTISCPLIENGDWVAYRMARGAR